MAIDKSNGHEYTIDPDNILADEKGRVYIARIVASLIKGRMLLPGEVVYHKNRIRTDNSPKNLKILPSRAALAHEIKGYAAQRECPVCSSLTTNYKYCSEDCYHVATRKVERPTKNELRELLSISNLSEIGRIYGVSDNAVRKWAKYYGII